MLALQRTVGNRAVAALVRGETKDVTIQAKLQVGPVNDAYEQEADKIARLVTSGFAQRKPVANVKSRDKQDDVAGAPQPTPALNIKRMIQRKGAHASDNPVHADGSFTADASVHERIRRMEQGGRPLPDRVRQEMEPRFGADLGGVRIHTGSDAVQLSRDIHARAFTHGSHIAFGAGGFNPNSQAGRHLLAHELTHTIQQTGARPLPLVQRSPKGVIQRGPTWQKIKNFFSRKKPEPVIPNISTPITGNPTQTQEAAFARATKAKSDADSLFAKAVVDADRKLADSAVSDEITSAGKSAKLDSAKDAVSGMQKGNQALKQFTEKYKQDLTEIRTKIDGNLERIAANSAQVTSNDPAMMQVAMQSHTMADESDQLVEKMREQEAGAGQKGDTELAAGRAGLSGSLGRYKARSIPAAEKSASDSVLDLIGIKGKVEGYFLYLSTDFKVLEGHLGSKGASVSQNFSEAAAMRAVGSGMARANSDGDPGMLDDEQAYAMAGGSRTMQNTQGPEGTEQDPEAAKKAEIAAGAQQGQKMLEQAQQSSGGAKGKKPDEVSKLTKSEKKFAKQIKRLEIRAMLYAKAQKRMVLAEQYTKDTDVRYQRAKALYDEIDVARSSGNQSPEQIDLAIRKAGDAREQVALAAVNLEKMRAFKKEVYDESQKYEKYVGKRAMSSAMRKTKKVVGMVAGAGLRVLTGGLYRIEAEDEAGGYRVGLKSRTILDDIIRKHYELKQILRGVDGKNVRGLGGKHGARAYVFFKGISFALQIVRDIASAAALWVTIITGGQGAPVGAVFASIALYSAISKAAIDLLLLIWSGVGLAMTNDPMSRSILRGENTRQGLAFGEGAFAAASGGLVMGLSGSTGLLSFQNQGAAFGAGSHTADLSGSMWGTPASMAVRSGVPVVGNIGQKLGVNAMSPYAGHANVENTKVNQQAEKVRKAKSAVRVLSHPVRSAFGALADLAQKKKRLRKSKFIAMLPEIAKTIEDLNSDVQEVPEGGKGEQEGSPSQSEES
ncbi:MAG: DUF4157 domain-containing protein [Caldilineaceae bacterium]|nr:DUF4157 domain-containing protein [Caldilineaceae bacterium]